MRLKHLLLLFALLATLIGCGGGGSSAPLTNGGALFMTDSLDNHSHVWITVNKVVLASAGGDVTAYDDPVGTTIDLKTLHDANGNRFSYLATIPEGTYTGITFTVDKTVTLFDQGNPVGYTRVFAGNNGTTADLSLTFSQARLLGPNSHCVVDFHLSTWNDDGTTITGNPFLTEGDDSGLGDDGRHEHRGYEGTVQSLDGTAPVQSFTLVHEHRSAPVVTTAQTALYNSDGSASPVLANGERVVVHGVFDVNQNAVVADWIMILVGGDRGHDAPSAEGAVSLIDTNAFTFALTVDEAHHFTPAQDTINVTTTADTVFTSHHGGTMTQADFFAALADGLKVQVLGSYDANTNTFAATRVRLDDEHQGGDHNSQVAGPASNINANAFTLDITAHDWEGMNIPHDQVVHIVTDGNTEYGDGMSAADFFAALTANQVVQAEGSYDSGTSTLTAKSLHTRH